MRQNWLIPDIPEAEKTPVVKALLALLEQVITHNQKLSEEVEHLKDEVNILKGEKKNPTFKASCQHRQDIEKLLFLVVTQCFYSQKIQTLKRATLKVRVLFNATKVSIG